MCQIVNERGMVNINLKEDTDYGGIGNCQSVTDAEDPEDLRGT